MELGENGQQQKNGIGRELPQLFIVYISYIS